VTELLGIDFTQFHFLRPAALWAMVPAAVLIGLLQWRKNSAGNWQQVINPFYSGVKTVQATGNR